MLREPEERARIAQEHGGVEDVGPQIGVRGLDALIDPALLQ
jgi:hypothetical protein